MRSKNTEMDSRIAAAREGDSAVSTAAVAGRRSSSRVWRALLAGPPVSEPPGAPRGVMSSPASACEEAAARADAPAPPGPDCRECLVPGRPQRAQWVLASAAAAAECSLFAMVVLVAPVLACEQSAGAWGTVASFVAWLGGVAVGAGVWGSVADARGRAFAVRGSAVYAVLGAVLCALAPSYHLWLVCLWLSGVGSGGSSVTRVLLVEWLPARARARYLFSSTACGVGGYLSILALAQLLPGITGDWRILCVAAAAANAVVAWLAWTACRESLPSLLARAQVEDARATVAELAAAGNYAGALAVESVPLQSTAPQRGAACTVLRRQDVASLIVLWSLAASARAIETVFAEGQVVVRGAGCGAGHGDLALLWCSELLGYLLLLLFSKRFASLWTPACFFLVACGATLARLAPGAELPVRIMAPALLVGAQQSIFLLAAESCGAATRGRILGAAMSLVAIICGCAIVASAPAEVVRGDVTLAQVCVRHLRFAPPFV